MATFNLINKQSAEITAGNMRIFTDDRNSLIMDPSYSLTIRERQPQLNYLPLMVLNGSYKTHSAYTSEPFLKHV